MKKFIFLLITFLSLNIFGQEINPYEKALQSYNNNDVDDAYIHLKNSLNQNPDHLPSKILMGNILFTKGFARDALIEFEEAVVMGADPNLITATMARTYLYLEDYRSIYELSDANLSKRNTFELLLIKATTAFNTNDDDTAYQFFKQAIDLYPRNLRGLQSLAYFYLYTNQYTELRAVIARLVSLNENDHRTLHLRAQLAGVQGNNEESVRLLERAYTENATDPLIKRSLATAYIKVNELDKATLLVEEIIEQTPDDPFAILLYGKLIKSSDKDTANQAFNEINQKLTLIPDELKTQRAELIFVQALSTYMTENYEQAAIELESYLLKNRQDINAISLLADTYMKLKQSFKALVLLEKNVSIFSNNLRLNLLLCDLYLATEKHFKCEQLIDELEKVLGNKNANLVFTRVKTLVKRDRTTEALNLYNSLFENQEGEVFIYTAIELLNANGKYEEALEKVETLLEKNPDDEQAKITKSGIFMKLGDFASAQSVLNSILKKNPESYSARRSLVQVLLRTGWFEQANNIIVPLMEENPSDTALVLMKGQLSMATDNYEQAIQELLKAKTLETDNLFASELLVRAYENSGDLRSAISEVNHLLRNSFLNPTYLSYRAELYIKTNQFKKAKTDMNSLYTIWDKEPSKLINLFDLQVSIRDFEGAEKTLSQALSLAPRSLIYRTELVKLHLLKNDKVLARQEVDALAKAFPNDRTIKLIEGEVARAEGNKEVAYRLYNDALLLDKTYVIAVVKMYQLAMEDFNGDKFLQTITELVNDKRYYRPIYENMMADYKLASGKKLEALAHYLSLAKYKNYQNLGSVYNNIANLYLTVHDDFDKAVQYSRRAVREDPDDPHIIDTQGWLLAKQERYEEALSYLRQAFALASEDPQIRYHLAYTLYHLGRVDEANVELERVLTTEQSAFFDRTPALELQNKIITEALNNTASM